MKEKVTKDEHLTPKQATFAQAYAYTNNMSLAQTKAGLTRGSGKKYIARCPQVVQAINEYRQQLIQQYIAQYQFCVKQYKSLYKKAIDDGDLDLASSIIQKISKLRQPMQGNPTNNNQIKIVIGTN